MRIIYLCVVFLFSFLNPGKPVSEPADPGSRVVQEIQILTSQDGRTQVRSVYDDESIESILYYLRLADAYGITDIDPDTFRVDPCQIIVCYISGDYTTYRQINNEYLQKDDGQWLRIHADTLLFPAL